MAVLIERFGIWGAQIDDDRICYHSYPLFPASVLSRPVIDASMIGEVNPNDCPPTIRLKSELLFLPPSHREPLRSFAAQMGIPVKNRFDIWGAILEPFLDTEVDESRHLAALVAHGVSETEVEQIRKRVGGRMFWHTFRTWEWVYYGLYDVLTVMQPSFFGKTSFRRFYSEAMEIALRSYR
jgi:hypothetical protein